MFAALSHCYGEGRYIRVKTIFITNNDASAASALNFFARLLSLSRAVSPFSTAVVTPLNNRPIRLPSYSRAVGIDKRSRINDTEERWPCARASAASRRRVRFFPLQFRCIAIQLMRQVAEGGKGAGGKRRKKVNPKTQLGRDSALVARVFAENTRVEDRLVDEK